MATTTVHVTGKRKRDDALLKKAKATKQAATEPAANKKNAQTSGDNIISKGVAPKEGPLKASRVSKDAAVHVQIVAGSYERVLHGISASIPLSLLQPKKQQEQGQAESKTPEDASNGMTFSDTFLFAAHASSVRCIAVSPPTEADKRFLATGSSDERINVYSISTTPSNLSGKVPLPTLASTSISENPRNRSLGSLIHHDRAITHLEFPAKGKLFSSAEDNTIAISRTRDWTVLSSIKAPIPKAQGRPSGDTAGPGETPAGVNDFAIHPSQKLMLSVGRGERCLRLWNLMTGKRAGVLNFDRDLLSQVGEGKYSSGEGRQVMWSESGESYVVAFERGVVVFGIDSKPMAIIKPTPSAKLHQMRMLALDGRDVLAVSTEDGRVLFFSIEGTQTSDAEAQSRLPSCRCLAELGGRDAGISGRIKDFEILEVSAALTGHVTKPVVITASSDGAIRVWSIDDATALKNASQSKSSDPPAKLGRLLGTLETGNRLTCMSAFVMDGQISSLDNEAEEAALGGASDSASEESD